MKKYSGFLTEKELAYVDILNILFNWKPPKQLAEITKISIRKKWKKNR